MTYSLDPQAEKELEDAFIYYREQGGSNLAQAFVTEFERVAELLCVNTGFGTPAGGTRRSYPLRRFPYSLIYRSTPSASAYSCCRSSAPSTWILAGSRLAALTANFSFTRTYEMAGGDAFVAPNDQRLNFKHHERPVPRPLQPEN
jgi:plasmid stabilization system protein ParE